MYSNWQNRNASFSILVNEFLVSFLYQDQYKKQETRFLLICITYKAIPYRYGKIRVFGLLIVPRFPHRDFSNFILVSSLYDYA